MNIILKKKKMFYKKKKYVFLDKINFLDIIFFFFKNNVKFYIY